jgi:hypothetical protein
MTVVRSTLSILLLCGLVVLLVHGNVVGLAVAAACAASIEVAIRRTIHWLFPILLFCAVLAFLEWIDHRTVSVLPLKALVSYLALALAFRIMPWVALVRSVPPRSWFFQPILFFLFIRHFTSILRDEALRSLTAYRLAVPHPFRRDGFRALAYSLDSFFRRCFFCAERFYAAQLLRGLAE